MTKAKINLSIDADLYEFIKNYKAVNTDFNISQELEEWIRIKMGHQNNETEIVDYDKEKARLLMELRQLESKEELAKREDEKEDMKIKTIDHAIDNAIKFGKKIEEIPDDRKNGVAFLFKSRYNVDITPLEAKELLENRIKERGL